MIAVCPKCKTEIFVKIKPRSRQENSYYWSVVVGTLADHTGFSPEEIHAALKMKFLKIVKGKLESCRSTTELTVGEFEDYLSKIRMFANEELNCLIPLPNEN